jgi:excisionase family DNA binding protein
MKTLLRISEFQEMYGLSRSTVYRLHDRGQLEFVHVGRAVRIRLEDAENWYASLSVDPSNDH